VNSGALRFFFLWLYCYSAEEKQKNKLYSLSDLHIILISLLLCVQLARHVLRRKKKKRSILISIGGEMIR